MQAVSSTLLKTIKELQTLRSLSKFALAGAKSTYALNLKHWIPENIEIKISIFKPYGALRAIFM